MMFNSPAILDVLQRMNPTEYLERLRSKRATHTKRRRDGERKRETSKTSSSAEYEMFYPWYKWHEWCPGGRWGGVENKTRLSRMHHLFRYRHPPTPPLCQSLPHPSSHHSILNQNPTTRKCSSTHQPSDPLSLTVIRIMYPDSTQLWVQTGIVRSKQLPGAIFHQVINCNCHARQRNHYHSSSQAI
jgi:hypothetical protein